VTASASIDPGSATHAALEAMLRSGLDEPSVRLGRLHPFGDGHSGHTFRAAVIDTASDSEVGDVVVRLSPEGVRIAGPADVGRQGRIMAALGAHGAAVPRVIAADSTGLVAGRAAAIMSLVAGQEWRSFAEAHSHDAVAAEAVAALQSIQAVPLAGSGIADETPFDLVGEIERWLPLLDRSPAEIHHVGRALHAELLEHADDGDPGAAPVLVHGDFHFGNLLYDDSRVVAVFDWEIASLGHPLSDVGCLAVAAMRRKYEPEPNPTGSVQVSRSRLAELYGAAHSAVAWHTAASCLKYAAILGYNLQLARKGRLDDPVYEQLQHTMRGLLTDGRHLLAGASDTESTISAAELH